MPARVDFCSLERSDAFAALKNRIQTKRATYHSSKNSHVTQGADDRRFTMQEHLLVCTIPCSWLRMICLCVESRDDYHKQDQLQQSRSEPQECIITV